MTQTPTKCELAIIFKKTSTSDARREGARSALLDTLALAVVLGPIAGRKFGR